MKFRPTHALPMMAVLVVASACSSDLASPPVSGARAALSTTSRPALRSNSIKYRDAGLKPGTGRSGSAALEARALLASDGTTIVEVTTGTIEGGTAPGQIAKVQLKHQGPTTDPVTNNYNGLAGNGYWTKSYAGLPHRSTIQVQANVRGIDPKRTDVVTVNTPVAKRPDLGASALAAPARSQPNTPVVISAQVAELNGDVGARTTCVLSVDGAAVSDAAGVWVDAGDVVTCSFTHTFADVGTHQISIGATSVVPGDWDTANNVVAGSIEIVSPEVRMSWGMSFDGANQNMNYGYDYRDWYYYGYYDTYHYEIDGFQNYRNVYVNGWSDNYTLPQGAVSFSGTLSTGGTEIGTASVAAYQDYWNGCWYGSTPQNTHFQLCPNYYGQLQLNAQQYSSRAVYYGYSYWNYYGYSYFSENSTYGFGDFAVGSTVGFDVKATDATGNVWRVQASAPVASWQESWSMGDYCNNYYYYYYYTNCRGGTTTLRWNGYGSGQ